MTTVDLLVEIIGWIGSGLCLGAYLLTSTGRLSGKSARYQAMNFVGGATLAINVLWHRAYPAALLEIGWAAIGLVALVGLARARHTSERARP
ncbi:MAG: hypothetical protein B7Y45_07550 [Sphingomonas sp. 28-66-16]|nr:MAG: hypothetical protein B7Y45_07550 [Sphingomonas sp. 28-66-16]